MTVAKAATVLSEIDLFYMDRSRDGESVVSALVTRLARPDPRDQRALDDLAHYKGLARRWQDWSEVTRVCGEIAQAILDGDEMA